MLLSNTVLVECSLHKGYLVARRKSSLSSKLHIVYKRMFAFYAVSLSITI